MKIKLIALLSFFALAINLHAQTESSETPQLKSVDVENFIKNFPAIQKEFDGFDYDFDAKEDLESLVAGMDGYNEVNTVVKKYGYADYIDFASKTWAIATCYSSIRLGNEGLPQVEMAIQEIEKDESMTAEQKEMAKAQIKAVMAAMGSTFTSMANEQDIEVVKPYVDKLDAIFDVE